MPFVSEEQSKSTYSPRALPPASTASSAAAAATTPPGAQKPGQVPAATGDDSIYGDDIDAANRAYDSAKADINYKRDGARTLYGMDTTGGIDDKNQTSLWKQTMRGYVDSLQGAEDDADSRGFAGHAGVVGRGIDDANYSGQVALSNWARNLQDVNHGLDVDYTNAGITKSQAFTSARANQIARKIAAQQAAGPEAPPPTAPVAPPPGAGQVPSAAALAAQGFDPWAISAIVANAKKTVAKKPVNIVKLFK